MPTEGCDVNSTADNHCPDSQVSRPAARPHAQGDNSSADRESQETLLRAKEEWERTFDSVPDLIAVLDCRHRILRVNKAMAARLGVKPEQCIGQPCFQCVHGASKPPTFCPHSMTLADGREHLTEVHEERLGGDFLVSTTPLIGGDGQIVGSVHVARDITEQKRTENALRKAKEQLAKANEQLELKVRERTAKLEEMVAELETFSYGMAHDMRAPLRAMQGLAAALLEDYDGRLEPEGRDYLQRIMAAAVRQDQFIQDMLKYSRVLRRQIDLRTVDLDMLVSRIINDYPNLNGSGGRIEVKRPLGQVLGHELSLAQCVANLLDNAFKFVDPGTQPRVQVRTERRADYVRLWVEDNGIGIAPENQERIFQMFERLHGREAYEGTGIGLAVVRKAVERMGGKVGVESATGEGSRFWIEAPAES